MFVDSIDSIDLSNREFLFSIGKVQLSIGLLHNIALVVIGPHKCLSIRSICQMENSYFRSERCCFPLDCCMSLQGLHKRLSIRSIWSIRFEKPLTTIAVSCTNMAGSRLRAVSLLLRNRRTVSGKAAMREQQSRDRQTAKRETAMVSY